MSFSLFRLRAIRTARSLSLSAEVVLLVTGLPYLLGVGPIPYVPLLSVSAVEVESPEMRPWLKPLYPPVAKESGRSLSPGVAEILTNS